MKEIVLAVALASGLVAYAQEQGEISTDRPDFTESTDTVAPGWTQLEGGVLASWHAMASGPEHAVGAPYSLLRFGLTRFAELRLSSDGFTSESRLVDGTLEQHGGGSDLELGGKVRLLDEKVHLPAFAFIAGASVPTGSGYFSSGRVNPFLELCWSKSLPGGFDAGGNVNFLWGGEQTEHAYSLSVGHKLGRGFSVYGEIYRISPIDGDEKAHWIANTGITKLLGSNAQLDVEVGHTMNARTPYWFVGGGFAFRAPAGGILNTLFMRAR